MRASDFASAVNTTAVGRELEQATLVCLVSLNDVMFEPNRYGDIAHGEFHSCSPVDGDGFMDGSSYALDLPDRIASEFDLRNDLGQELYVEVPRATLTADTVLVHNENDIRVVDRPGYLQNRRRLAAPARMGTLEAIVVRISGRDSQPSFSASRIYDLLFKTGDISMRTQFQRCSNRKLDIKPSPYGVMDVRVDLLASESSHGAFVNAGNQASKALLPDGVRSVRDAADLVLFIVPPGVGNFAAYATVNGQMSAYNDKWATYLGAQLHEIGHNLGLRHAWKNGIEYNGRSGSMGTAPQTTKFPLRCFNGENNWEMGWYGDAQVEAIPAIPKTYKIFAFVDAQKYTPGDGFAVVRVGDYYLQYNRAKDFNRDTTDGSNRLTVVKSIDRGTDLVAALSQNTPVFVIPGSSVTIDVCGTYSGGSDSPDYLIVGVGDGGSACRQPNNPVASSRAPIPQPTRRPTPVPTARPTSRPTVRPTPRPTPVPTQRPTPIPSNRPTFPPTFQPTSYPTGIKLPTSAPFLSDGETSRPSPSIAASFPTGVNEEAFVSTLDKKAGRANQATVAVLVVLLFLTMIVAFVIFILMRRRKKRKQMHYFFGDDDGEMGRVLRLTKHDDSSSELLNETLPDDSSYISGPFGHDTYELPVPRASPSPPVGFIGGVLASLGLVRPSAPAPIILHGPDTDDELVVPPSDRIMANMPQMAAFGRSNYPIMNSKFPGREDPSRDELVGMAPPGQVSRAPHATPFLQSHQTPRFHPVQQGDPRSVIRIPPPMPALPNFGSYYGGASGRVQLKRANEDKRFDPHRFL